MALELGVIAIEHYAPKFPADELNRLRELAEDLRKMHDARRRAGSISRGAPPRKNPTDWSPSYRAKMESKQRQTERKANTDEDR